MYVCELLQFSKLKLDIKYAIVFNFQNQEMKFI